MVVLTGILILLAGTACAGLNYPAQYAMIPPFSVGMEWNETETIFFRMKRQSPQCLRDQQNEEYIQICPAVIINRHPYATIKDSLLFPLQFNYQALKRRQQTVYLPILKYTPNSAPIEIPLSEEARRGPEVTLAEYNLEKNKAGKHGRLPSADQLGTIFHNIKKYQFWELPSKNNGDFIHGLRPVDFWAIEIAQKCGGFGQLRKNMRSQTEWRERELNVFGLNFFPTGKQGSTRFETVVRGTVDEIYFDPARGREITVIDFKVTAIPSWIQKQFPNIQAGKSFWGLAYEKQVMMYGLAVEQFLPDPWNFLSRLATALNLDDETELPRAIQEQIDKLMPKEKTPVKHLKQLFGRCQKIARFEDPVPRVRLQIHLYKQSDASLIQKYDVTQIFSVEYLQNLFAKTRLDLKTNRPHNVQFPQTAIE